MNIKEKESYKKLERIKLFPLVFFLALVMLVGLVQIVIFNNKYVPEIRSMISAESSTEIDVFVIERVEKIIVALEVSWFLQFLIGGLLVYLCILVRKLISDMELLL